MIKVVTTLKKRPGLTTEEFRTYYEDHHRVIGEKYLNGFAARYVRRYLDALPDHEGTLASPEFDVLLEIWFNDKASFEACSQRLNEPDIAREIIFDEEKLFDRSQKRSYLLEEYESQLTK
jgi:hypothetical protein